ncbi:MAG: hypothetical protein IKH41_07270, partial [Clostridia bacterium]|nr:hypothetical protein [Clostridia bacterium]
VPGGSMFTANYKELTLSFNEFHNVSEKDMPQYGEYCLLELKNGDYTAGEWNPQDYKNKKSTSGMFIRGTADSIDSKEVERWHSLERYDLTECLEDEEIDWINLGPEKEGIRNVQFKGFKSFADKKKPKEEQFCLLIMNDGSLAAGRWNKWRGEAGGAFIYAPALGSYSSDEVWAWTPLSTDQFFAMELELENEKKREKKLNRNPSADPELFKYGMDIDVYYEKALEKLREEYYWATVTMMKKQTPVWQIAPLHGKYVFGQISKSYFDDSDIVTPWTEGRTSDEFINFLCGYTRDAVKNSNPEEKFKFGTDINVYLEKAFNNVKKDYRWLDKKMLKNGWRYDIRRVDGDLEFVRKYRNESRYSVYDVESAEKFIESVEYDYRSAALQANEIVASYSPKFGHIELHGWNLERYVFYKMQSGDYKVSVTAGNRTTGGSRDFFITPYCFEAKTYEEFLDRYLEIVPDYSFGLGKKELLPNEDLKKFLGY